MGIVVVHNIVIFECISTRLGGEMYILLSNSRLKFHAEMYALQTYQQKLRGLLF